MSGKWWGAIRGTGGTDRPGELLVKPQPGE